MLRTDQHVQLKNILMKWRSPSYEYTPNECAKEIEELFPELKDKPTTKIIKSKKGISHENHH